MHAGNRIEGSTGTPRRGATVRGLRALLWLILACAAGPAWAGGLGFGCTLVSSGLDYIIVEPNEPRLFQFSIEDDGSSSCTTADGTITVNAPDGSAVLVSGPTFVGDVGDTIDVEVMSTSNVGVATFDVDCIACSGSPLQFTLDTVAASVWVLDLVTPADGDVVTGGSTVTLTINVTDMGAPVNGELMRWEFLSNTNGSSFVGGPVAGAPITQPTVNSSNTVTLAVGAPNAGAQPVTIRATIGYDSPASQESLDFTLFAEDIVTVDSNNPAADDQSGTGGNPVPVPYSVVVHRNGTADALAGPIAWSVSPAGAVVLSATETPTDGGGSASVTATFGSVVGPFTVTAAHADYPGVSEVFSGEVLGTANVTITQAGSGSGNGQSGPAGTALPQPLVALVTQDSAPTEDESVTWSVVSGDAVLTGPNPADSDDDGLVSMTVTLGTTPGDSIIRATLTDDTTQFVDYTVTVDSTVVATLGKPTVDSGDGQSAPIGTPLPDPLKALATNNGAPVSGVTVNWTVIAGTASLANPTSVTDVDGLAGVSVTLGSAPGTVVIRATRADASTATTDFTLTATPATATVYTLTKPTVGSGDGQDGFTGEPLPQSLVVIANDNGVAAPGVTIQWAVTGGDATLDAPTSLTNASGRASMGLTFGDTPGTVSVTATRADAPLATSTFVLNSSPAVPDDLGIDKPENSGDGGNVAPGESLTLTARTLRNTLPTPFLRVAWQVVSGDATLRPTVTTSQGGGLTTSQLVAGPTAGPIQVRAYLLDAPDASVLYTINGASGGVLSIVSGNNQQAAPGQQLSLVVSYLTNGVPMPGVGIDWEILEGTAELVGTLQSTGSNGQARTMVLLGDTPGPVRVRASSGTQSVVFDLTITDAAPSLVIVAGNNQSGPTETQADAPLVVEARDALGAPLSERNVMWEILAGSASLAAVGTSTDSNGRASNTLDFGTTAGAVTVLAYLPGLREQGVRFELVASAPTLSVHAGNGQSGAPGDTLAEDFIVAVGVPSTPAKGLAGVTITWTVLEGGGTLSQVTSIADSSGLARTRLTLGPQAGTNRVRATATGGASVDFTATAVSSAAASIDVVSGSVQSLAPQAASAPLVVLVRDAAGAPVADALVTWGGDNAAVASTSTRTGSDGRASTTARVLLPGAATVTATLDGSNATASFAINAGLTNIPGLTGPQRDVADAIDRFCPELATRTNLGPEQADLRARCLELVNAAGTTPGAVGDALEAMRQDVAFGQSNAAYAAVGAQFDNLKTRIAALRSGASGLDLGGLALASSTGVVPLSLLPADPADDSGGSDVGSDFSRWGFFASGTIGRGSQDGDDATPEYDFDSNGLTAGVDYRFSDTLIVGVSAGWNQQDTDLARDGGSIETTGWSLSAYSTWYRDNAWYLDGVLSFGQNDYDLIRNVRYSLPGADGGTTQIDQRATAASDGEQRSLAISFGKDVQKGAWSLGPYFRGTWTQVDFDAYSERMLADRPGAGLGLAVDARDLESRTAVLGGKASYAMSRDWGVLMPHMQVEWEHEFEDDPDALVARFLHDPTFSAIATQGEALDRNYYNVGFGLSALFPGGKSAFFYYERLIGASGQSQDNLSLGVRFEF